MVWGGTTGGTFLPNGTTVSPRGGRTMAVRSGAPPSPLHAGPHVNYDGGV